MSIRRIISVGSYEDLLGELMKRTAYARSLSRDGYARSNRFRQHHMAEVLVSDKDWMLDDDTTEVVAWSSDKAGKEIVVIMLGHAWEPRFPMSPLEKLAEAAE